MLEFCTKGSNDDLDYWPPKAVNTIRFLLRRKENPNQKHQRTDFAFDGTLAISPWTKPLSKCIDPAQFTSNDRGKSAIDCSLFSLFLENGADLNALVPRRTSAG